MIKVLLEGAKEPALFPILELEKRWGIRWLYSLEFGCENSVLKILKKCRQAVEKKQLSVRESWSGVRFLKEIRAGKMPEISIRFIDKEIQFGVFAEKDFSVGTFIGEYTGLIRKRKKQQDKKNDYCFEYTIGDWRYNPFIIDASVQGNHTRFINHSDHPNLDTLSVYADGLMHIILVAVRPIKKGEQLCYHYGDYFWGKKQKRKKVLFN